MKNRKKMTARYVLKNILALYEEDEQADSEFSWMDFYDYCGVLGVPEGSENYMSMLRKLIRRTRHKVRP